MEQVAVKDKRKKKKNTVSTMPVNVRHHSLHKYAI